MVVVLWVEVRDGGWDDGSASAESGREGGKKGLGTSLTTSSTVLFYCLQSECAGPMNCCEEESQHQGRTGYEERWDNEFYHKDWCGREGVHIDITALRCSG